MADVLDARSFQAAKRACVHGLCFTVGLRLCDLKESEGGNVGPSQDAS